ncbi:serine protein kinase RIO [Nanoarchaeota archaeon]
MVKSAKEKFKTYQDVFDSHTIRNLFVLGSKGLFDENSLSPIATGKEANVFAADSKNGRVVVKIYRVTTCDFNKMYEYIRTDPRFPKLTNKRRKVIFAWAKREYRNLLRAREKGVSVPTAHAFKDNILVMSLIGDEWPASKLKDEKPKDLKKFFEKTIDNMKKLKKAGLIHGDLSEFNILNHNDLPYFIDFSQCTQLNDPLSEELLTRDVKNMERFFNKLGLKVTEQEIRKKIG